MSDVIVEEEEEEELKDLLAYDAKEEEEEVLEERGEVRLPRFDRMTALEIEGEEEEDGSRRRVKMNMCSMFTIFLVFTCMVLIIVYMWEVTELDFGQAKNASNASVTSALTYLQYNIDEGGGIGTSRYENIMNWVSSQHVDMIGFCELNGWQQNAPSMSERANAMGFQYSHLYEVPSGYNLGIMSRFPLTVIEATSNGFERGVLHVRIEPENVGKWDVFVVHLNAHNATLRVLEARRLNEMILKTRRDLGDDNTIVLVTGDFNTLSSYDRVTYDHENLLSFLLNHSESHLRDKLTVQGEISYESFQTILNGSNLVDPCAIEDFNICGATEPTSVSVDQAASESDRVPDMRLDYILFDKFGLESYVPVCSTIRDVDVVDLSDHFPIRCVFVRR